MTTLTLDDLLDDLKNLKHQHGGKLQIKVLDVDACLTKVLVVEDKLLKRKIVNLELSNE